MKIVPERDRSRTCNPDVEHRLRVTQILREWLTVAPHRPRAHNNPSLLRRRDAHSADGHAIALVVIVHDEQFTDAGLHEPFGYRVRSNAVVRHEAHKGGPSQTDEGRDRR